MAYNKTADNGFVNLGLAPPLTSGEALAVEEIVEISGDYQVMKPTAPGSVDLMGEVVIPCDSSGDSVTIATFFTKLRTYTTGAAVSVGAIVLDANNNVIDYNSGVHDSAAIFALALEADSEGGNDVLCLVR